MEFKKIKNDIDLEYIKYLIKDTKKRNDANLDKIESIAKDPDNLPLEIFNICTDLDDRTIQYIMHLLNINHRLVYMYDGYSRLSDLFTMFDDLLQAYWCEEYNFDDYEDGLLKLLDCLVHISKIIKSDDKLTDSELNAAWEVYSRFMKDYYNGDGEGISFTLDPDKWYEDEVILI